MADSKDYNEIGYLGSFNKPNLEMRLSEHQKRKKDYEWAKHMLDYYDSYYQKDDKDYSRYDENYELHRGSWSQLEDEQDDLAFKYKGEEYGVSGLKLRHYPIINTISMRILGEIIQRPLIPLVRDFSASSKNYRDRQRLQVAQKYLHNKLIQPRAEAIRSQYFQRLGIDDPASLSGEQQQQIEQEVNKSLQAQLPEDLMASMESQLSPEEIIYQNFLNRVIKDEKIEEKFILGAENAIVTGEEYYRINIINGRPKVEVLNPKYVTWRGSEHTEFIEDGTYAKYEQYLTPQDIVQKYGKHLVKKDLDELERLFVDFAGGGSNAGERWKELEFTQQMANHPELQDWAGDIKTRDGQDKLKLLWSALSRHTSKRTSGVTDWGIRECYVCWKWFRNMKLVTRQVNGKRVELWKADHYTKNAAKGDLKVERKLVPQVWHGVILGESGSQVKINVGPVPWQYNNMQNPFDVKLPIHGCRISTHMNNTKNVSFIDLGKPYQYEYNSLRRDWEKYRRTNLGRVLLGTVNMIPDNMNIGDFYAMLDNIKLALVSDKYEGMSPRLDLNAIRSIDLSNGQDMEQVLEDMAVVKNEMYQAMYFNPAKLGQQGQYTTATTAQMNLQASDAQLAKFHNKRRQIKENVLQYTLDLTIAAYADNDDMKAQVLDDLSIAYLEANYEFLSTREASIFVVDDYRENQKLEFVRQQLQAFIQNGANIQEIIAITRAESLTEMQQIAEKVERRQQKQAQAEQEQEMQIVQQQNKAKMDLERWREEMKSLREERNNEVKLAMAELNAMTLANANDIDKNQIPDSLTNTLAKMQAEKEMQKAEHQHEERLKDKELAVKD